ncbi:MAG: hypothetical protein EBU01_12500 [Crocinitomicaceae bacterium]|nr:hypothetical protein [Crocinitomicaceae bacterium]
MLTTYASPFSADNKNQNSIRKKKSKRHLPEQENPSFFENDVPNSNAVKLNQQQLDILNEADKLTTEEFSNNNKMDYTPYEKNQQQSYSGQNYSSILPPSTPKPLKITSSNYVPLQGQTQITSGGDFNPFYAVPKPILLQQSQKENVENRLDNISQDSKNNVIDKLDYIIHLLEENANEKTDYVMEEFCLYSFLGVFMIFVVDSFSKSNRRYVR